MNVYRVSLKTGRFSEYLGMNRLKEGTQLTEVTKERH